MTVEKATITNTVTNEQIPVLFNPEDYTLQKANTFAQATVPGLSSPILQFVSGNMQTLTMELLADTLEAHRGVNAAGDDVRTITDRIAGLMDIDASTHAPPVLLFTWGSLAFLCVLASVSQRFVLFAPDGTPVRARLSVTFNEYRNAELEAKTIKRETADYTKLHTVTLGETLPGIAYQVYGDAALWRPIALLNRLDHPQDIAAGLRLLIPRLPYRDPASGEVYS
ncbi:MAG: peptigoglycan-binding protein LysM [Anaerolineae bacterium]|nr:peptigoglycan-binding protein LysM [Anaerolineae bacterium]